MRILKEDKASGRALARNQMESGLSALICLALVMGMGMRWKKTGKFMPAGMVSSTALAMLIFLLYRIQTPVPLAKKDDKKGQ